MKIDREGLSLVAAALAAPVRNFGAFLCCGLVPLLICLAAVGAVALTQSEYPGGSEAPSTPLYLSAFAFFLTGLALLSLVSFTIHWRRSLASEGRAGDPASLLSIDMRSVAYIFAKFRGPKPNAPGDAAPKAPRRWVKGGLGLVGLLILMALVLMGMAIGLFALLILFKPTQDSVSTFLAAFGSGFFVSTAFGPQRWRASTAIALDIAPADLPAASRTPPFLPLAVLVWLIFFSLAVVFPVPTAGPPVATLLTAAAWIGALFLATGWFAALETRMLTRDLGAPGAEPLHIAAARGHRQFRTPQRPAGA